MVENVSIPAQHNNQKSQVAAFGQRKGLPFFKPFIQPKLSINTPNDIYEQEADAVADKVMRMTDGDIGQSSFFKPAVPVVQLKCAHCEEEEKKVNRKEINDDETIGYPGLDKYVDNLDNNGQSLPGDVRNFYEPRLGYDFSNVKVHTDTIAAKSAQSINALAFTSGNHIVFNSGQYSPGTDSGKRLLGHELTHVVQQGSDIHAKQIQRMSIGSASPPASWVTSYNARMVPPDEVARVQAAIDMIANIVNHPNDYSDCLQAFIDRCTGNSPTAFADAFNNAVIWRGDATEGENARGTTNGTNIIYMQSGYDQGTRGLAQTLVHEMGHNCGISGGDDHYLAEVNANYCMGPLNQFGFRFSAGLNTSAYGLAVTYRRFFDLALGGQLQLSLGADFDIIGTTLGITDAAGDRLDSILPEFEFGSVSAGLRGRFNPWGGEGFGGITLGAETGFDAGRFRIVREAGPEFEYGAGFILQSTVGAEFYIPANPHIYQISVDAGYRLIRPLNPEAENIHELIFGINGMF